MYAVLQLHCYTGVHPTATMELLKRPEGVVGVVGVTKSAARKLQTSRAIGLRCRYNGDLFETGAANISATGQLQELISLVRRRTPRAWNHTYSVDVHGDASQARLLPASTAAMCAAWCG